MFTEWLNMKNFEIWVLTANSRYLQTAALEQPQKPADKVRSSWFHDEQMQASVTTIQLDSMTYPSVFAANGNNRATKDKIISYQFRVSDDKFPQFRHFCGRFKLTEKHIDGYFLTFVKSISTNPSEFPRRL